MRGRVAAPAFAATLLLAAAGVAIAAPAAQAAERHADITNSRVLLNGKPVDGDTELRVGQQLRFEADWSIAGQVNAGDTFSVPLPSAMKVVSSAPFFLKKDGKSLARCVYDIGAAPGAIDCTFLPGGPYGDPSGDIWFVASLQDVAPGEPGPIWNVGGDPVVLPVPTPIPDGPWKPAFGTFKAGMGDIVDGRAVLYWSVFMWAGTGPGANQEVREFKVSDQLESSAPNQPHVLIPGSFVLDRWQQDPSHPEAGVVGTQKQLPFDGTYKEGDPAFLGEVFSAPEVDASGTAYTFEISNLAAGYEYRLRYQSEATGAVSFESDVFSNTAEVNGEELPATVSPTAWGGGGADASDYTSFSVSKHLTNESTVTLPETFELIAKAGDVTQELRVPADGTRVNSGYFVAGAPITLCEVLPDVNGVVWKKYTVTGPGVSGPDADGCYTLTGAGGERVEIVLNNVADAVVVPPRPTPTPTPTVTPTPTATPTPEPSVTTPPTVPPVAPEPTEPGDTLATTGADPAALVVTGLSAALLLLTGAGLFVYARRRAAAE